MWKSYSFPLGLVLLILNLNISELGCEAGVQIRRETLEEEYPLNNLLQNNTFEKFNKNDQKLIVRLPSNTLLKYTSYKDVSILHFRVPEETRTALFTFKAFEESKSAFHRSCKPRSVTLHLKASSYPVISPENITFPASFIQADQRLKIFSMDIQSDEKDRHILVEGPKFGNWFAIAFISWTDPNCDRIEQQGLTASCDTLMAAEMSITQFEPIILGNQQTHENILVINATEVGTKKSTNLKNTSNIDEAIYKFFVPEKVGVATAYIQILSECVKCPNLVINLRAGAFPQTNRHGNLNILNTNITGNKQNNRYITFDTQQNTWHYILLRFENTIESDSKLELKYSLEFEYELNKTENVDEKQINVNNFSKHFRFRNIEMFPLLRQTYREFFMYDYDLLPDENDTVPLVLNLTAGTTSGFAMDIGEVYDIGGTLTFALTMKTDKKTSESLKSTPTISPETERSVLVAEKLVWMNESNSTLVDKSVEATNQYNQSNQTIIVCMHLGEPGTPTWPDKCQYGTQIFPAAVIVNNTDLNSSSGVVNVPFPESGLWYITMGLFCHGDGTAAGGTIIDSVKKFVYKNANTLLLMKPPCACANNSYQYEKCLKDPNCILNMNETEVLKLKECLLDSKCYTQHEKLAQDFEKQHKLASEEPFAVDNCNASVVFSISSSPCVAGRCGRFGRCYHYMSGGFVFSTCVCMRGYRGWDCTEDSNVPSNMSILLASLLLTLSNLLFIPSVYVSIIRAYYTEAVIYFSAMFFSIFYHACDSGEDEYSFCLVKIGVLQFCDFYCGLLAIWVTLVTMSHAKPQIISLLHMLGAIVLAFGTELDKQSLWVFLAPALTGICLISVSWGLRCYKSRALFPSKEYLSIFLPLGAVLVMIGLVCYAFLQTKQNYHIVHSIWHMLMALSLLCLLPSRGSFLGKS